MTHPSKERREIPAVAWNRFHSRFLAVHPSLLGKTHSFRHNEYHVEVALPNVPIRELIDALHGPPREDARVEILAWRESGNRIIPTALGIADVDVVIQLPRPLRIHAEMLDRPPNAYDLLSEADVTALNTLGAQFRESAEAAIDYWFRVIRWKTRIGSIGRPLVRDSRTGWATYFLHKRTRHRVWAAPRMLTAAFPTAVTPAQWEASQRALAKQLNPPIYFGLYFDGIEHKKVGDLQRSVIDFAVASEVLLRQSLIDSLPKEVSPPLVRYIDDANIRPVLTKFFPELLAPRGRAVLDAVASKLHRLFDARNDILHSGRADGLTEELVSELQAATLQLISLPDQKDNWAS